MERTVPVNPERNINLLLKIWLCPNASAFKIVKAIPAASNYRKNYHDRSAAFAFLIGTEFLILFYFFPNMPQIILNRWLFSIFLVHGVPELFYNKKINVLAFDYDAYYPRFLLYLFLIFLLVGLVLFGKMFYDEIGHIK